MQAMYEEFSLNLKKLMSYEMSSSLTTVYVTYVSMFNMYCNISSVLPVFTLFL